MPNFGAGERLGNVGESEGCGGCAIGMEAHAAEGEAFSVFQK